LAALLIELSGFRGLFGVSAIFYVVVAVLAARLPELGGGERRAVPVAGHVRDALRGRIVFAVLAFVLVQGAGALGVATLPLFVTTIV